MMSLKTLMIVFKFLLRLYNRKELKMHYQGKSLKSKKLECWTEICLILEVKVYFVKLVLVFHISICPLSLTNSKCKV